VIARFSRLPGDHPYPFFVKGGRETLFWKVTKDFQPFPAYFCIISINFPVVSGKIIEIFNIRPVFH